MRRTVSWLKPLSGFDSPWWIDFDRIRWILDRKLATDFLKMNAKTQLREALAQALQKRVALALTDRCLVNGAGDNLADLVIHDYGGHVFLQTFAPERDAEIPVIQNWLQDNLQPHAIWLKNHSPLRQKRGLVLREELLFGVDAPTLKIENAFAYSTRAPELFPLQERWLRRQCQKHFAGKNALLVKPESETLFWETGFFQNARAVSVSAPHWADLCGSLREWPQTFEMAICKMPFLIESEKNKKALFHVFFNLLQGLRQNAALFLRLDAGDGWVLPLLNRAGQARQNELRLLQWHAGELDLPQIPGNKGLAGWWQFRCG